MSVKAGQAQPSPAGRRCWRCGGRRLRGPRRNGPGRRAGASLPGRAARPPRPHVPVDDLLSGLHAGRRGGATDRRDDRERRVLHGGAKVGDPDAYRGTDATGTLHFPGFGPDACEWLLRRRGIRSLGVDTLSIDPGNSTTFETHLILTGADRYGVENLANLDRIPKRGATIVVGLIPYEEGSGGQARVFASW